ncbi:hypothetical protein VTO42DRAFT_8732 [Malbranchea cinnamomea]
MAAATTDFAEHFALRPDGLTIREDTPTDTSSLINSSPTEDPLTANWSQWMRWDELDVDDISDHVEHADALLRPDTTRRTPEQTVAPGDLNGSMAKPDLTFHGALSQKQQQHQQHQQQQQQQQCHLRGLSTSSMDFNPVVCPPSFTSPFSVDSLPTTISLTAVQNQFPQQRQFHQQSQQGVHPVNATTNGLLSPISTSSPPTRKRKSSTDDETLLENITPEKSTTPVSKSLPSKKRSHNVIEKRYRANLNEKIAELRDAVPSLRAIYRQRQGGAGANVGADDEEAIASGNKLNKASILSKATEYIKHLEVRNKRLDEENMALKNRLRELEKCQEHGLAAFGSVSGFTSSPSGCTVSTDSATGTSPGVFSHTEDNDTSEGSPNPLYPPEGLIKVPESFKRLRAAAEPQPHYADSLLARQKSNDSSDSGSDSSGRSRGMANKFMIGTLAGLMVVGGLESRKETDPSERALLAVPFQFLGELFNFCQRYLYLVRATSWYIRALSQVVMTSAFVVGCAFVVFLYLFYSRPRDSRGPFKQRAAQTTTSTAVSPAEFRREAWLTSIQTVGVPRHTFFHEWYAVTSRCLEYCLRCLLGWSLYSWLTGISEEDERGRVKAWDIALDAQLTGGDAEVSKSRLVLTIFAAGTLPRSPARCMLKSMHCRILLWRVGVEESVTGEIADNVAFALARYQWQLAQQMQRDTPEDHEDHLPGHLAFLLTKSCDEVLTDNIIQRASNMIWGRPTQEATDGGDALLDVVVEDTAIRSPLDALAAWWSSAALQDALICLFDSASISSGAQRRKGFEKKLDLALKSAPITSTAYTRAAAIKAVFFDEGRVDNINAVLAALPRSKCTSNNNVTIFVDTSVPPSARAEISMAVRCAMIAAILKGQAGSESSPEMSLRNAIELFNKLPIDPVELTLLGFSSLYHLLHIMANDERLVASSSLSSSYYSSSSDESSHGDAGSRENRSDSEDDFPLPDLARVASGLIYWVRNAYNPISAGFTSSIAEKIIDGCVEACQNAGVHIDPDAVGQDMAQPSQLSSDNGHRKQESLSETTSEASDASVGSHGSGRSSETGYTTPGSEEVKEDR